MKNFSTPNLKTRIEKILLTVCDDWHDKEKKAADELESLLSSELSLVINELREAIHETLIRPCGHANGPNCQDCRDKREALFAFDIKAKELQEKV